MLRFGPQALVLQVVRLAADYCLATDYYCVGWAGRTPSVTFAVLELPPRV